MNFHISTSRAAHARGSRWNPLTWLMGADAAHRERQHLAALGDSTLKDIGLTRAAARRGAGEALHHWRHLS